MLRVVRAKDGAEFFRLRTCRNLHPAIPTTTVINGKSLATNPNGLHLDMAERMPIHNRQQTADAPFSLLKHATDGASPSLAVPVMQQ